MTNKPTVLIVPGAWHYARTFERVSKLLREAGYKIDEVDLASFNPSAPVTDMSADTEKIRSRIEKAVNAGEEVVLVGHSYGGIPAAGATKGLDLEARKKEGKSGGVKHLFLCCSFIVDEGSSLMGSFGVDALPWFAVSEDRMEVNPIEPEKIFYNDMTKEDQDEWIAKLKPHSFQVMHTPVTYAAWKHVPTTYFYCKQDNAIPLQIQQMMVEQVAKGYPIQTDIVDASHSPFFSKPKETADAIRRAAGESV